MVFYIKDAPVKIKCDHSPMQIHIFSDRNDKANNWSPNIHAITPYKDFEHIKGKDNVMEDSLSRLKTLGLYEVP